MKTIGEAATAEERSLEEALANFGWRGRYDRAVPSVVSPVHRGVANACFRFDGADGDSLFVKVPQADMAPLLDPAAAAEAARIAGEAGVTPPLAAFDPATGVAAFGWLGDGWDYARNDALARPEVLKAVLSHKRRLHDGPAFPRSDGPFERIDRLEGLLSPLAVHLPPDLPWLRDNLGLIRQALTAAGWDSRPCHLDQPASNVMLGPGGAVLLVDFDSASMADPWYDIGAFLTEAFQFEEDVRGGIAAYAGTCSDALFARARLWAIVDDLLWALWATWCFATSPRRDIEFFKYASWRFMRARMTLLDWRFETWLRQL